MLIAPGWFLRELEAFDPALRLRWSDSQMLWHLERKIAKGKPVETLRTDSESDEVIRAREGYLLVASVPPGGLNRTIFEKLRACDLWALGGWEKVEREIVEAEEREEQKRDDDFAADIRSYTREVYEFLKHRAGERVFNAGM